MKDYQPGSIVRHAKLGEGKVVADTGETAVVRFATGIDECLKADIKAQRSLEDRLTSAAWDSPLAVAARVQAEAILSANNTWGVFTRSQIELLPHQLWVCRQVTREWPFRWLVADDVGLGKTIEAGLILTPLLSGDRVKRVLVLTPASLAPQWQYRLRTMFDIRMALYASEADRENTGFWETHDLVVASYHTLRLDSKGRQERLLDSEPWDLVMVDEAHHMNNDEHGGATLGYQLLQRLLQEGKVESMIFFTGTPHRGKNFGFLSLLQLLRPDDFDPREPLEEQLHLLHKIMIRNNKYAVTDLHGNRLFCEPVVESRTFEYTDAERAFYERLSRFILEGRAYASTLDVSQQRAVMLVLTTMQKLASSSIAAIRRAIQRRLARLHEQSRRLRRAEAAIRDYAASGSEEDEDRVAELEEQIPVLTSAIRLTQDEEGALQELLEEASAIDDETKINCIVDLVDQELAGRQVLFFTEYKATQALLISELHRRFGGVSTTFINGDERLDEVPDESGGMQSIRCTRELAAADFNSGRRRFLVATEAAGEGIDLQENCWTLVHVDLPWNPMRLHQRVGRLNRYGQTRKVQVFNFRNPQTVESRIWELLNEKIGRISLALASVMKDPENVFELVLGMTPAGMFDSLFSEGQLRSAEDGLDEWFDERTATFGGEDALDTVRKIVGNVAKFDFSQVAERLPKVDLPDLAPFLRNSLAYNGRRLLGNSTDGYSFRTPEPWRQGVGIMPKYENMLLDRNAKGKEARKRILGVGHVMIDNALKQLRQQQDAVAILPKTQIDSPVFIFRVYDRLTDRETISPVICALRYPTPDSPCELLHDWQLLKLLNGIPPSALEDTSGHQVAAQDMATYEDLLCRAKLDMANRLNGLCLEFELPRSEILGVLVPVDGCTDSESVTMA